jgi:hypothetical protein
MISKLEFPDVPMFATASTLTFIKEFCDARRIPLIEYKRGSIDNTHDHFSTVWVEVPSNFKDEVFKAVNAYLNLVNV